MKSSLINNFFFSLLVLILPILANARVLEVGLGYTYQDMYSVSGVAKPGDTVLIHAGIYPGNQILQTLHGTSDKWIYFMPYKNESVVFKGGNECFKISSCSYLYIQGITFLEGAVNTVNVDDQSGSITHHLIFSNCVFKDVLDNIYSDALKLSGVDNFEVRNCSFINQSVAMGSAIDMTGCHGGIISNCLMENIKYIGIRIRGASKDILVERNFLKNILSKPIVIGGDADSTITYFRPLASNFSASNINVYSNIISGGENAIIFSGCINSNVINNTIYRPTISVLSILQEIDSIGYVQCANNTFINNIISITNESSTKTIITGPNTLPQTFTFSNNLWFNSDDPNWKGPTWPVAESNTILGKDPLFKDPANDNFTVSFLSPAIGSGYAVAAPQTDYIGHSFDAPRTIGALDGPPKPNTYPVITPYGSQEASSFYLSCTGTAKIYNRLGALVKQVEVPAIWDATDQQGEIVPMGEYYIKCSDKETFTVTVIK